MVLDDFCFALKKQANLSRWSISFFPISHSHFFPSEISFSWLINLWLKTTDNIFQSANSEIVLPWEMKKIVGFENNSYLWFTIFSLCLRLYLHLNDLNYRSKSVEPAMRSPLKQGLYEPTYPPLPYHFSKFQLHLTSFLIIIRVKTNCLQP